MAVMFILVITIFSIKDMLKSIHLQHILICRRAQGGDGGVGRLVPCEGAGQVGGRDLQLSGAN